MNVWAQVMKLIVYKCNGEITSLNQVFKPVKDMYTNVKNMKFNSM